MLLASFKNYVQLYKQDG